MKGTTSTVLPGDSNFLTLLRVGGYTLLVLSLLDVLEALIPPRLMDPTWELAFIGGFIERSPVLLVGFVLAFCGLAGRRAGRRLGIGTALSWTALGVGVAELLMIPLLLNDSFRLETINAARLNSQLDQQLSQAQRLEGALSTTPDQNLDALIQQLGRKPSEKPPQELRAEILGDVAKAKRTLQSQAEEAVATARLNLFKRSFKWTAQALCVGIALVLVWRTTAWARRSRDRSVGAGTSEA